MSMKRTCAISSRKSDLVSADILGLSAKNLRGLSRNQKTGNGCFVFCLVSHSISRQVFTRTVSRDESRMKILIGVPLFFASLALADDFKARSEERRVGKECRSRCWAYVEKRN